MSYPDAAWRRAMTVQEGMLKAESGHPPAGQSAQSAERAAPDLAHRAGAGDLQPLVEKALRALGSEGGPPTLAALPRPADPDEGGLLQAFGIDLTSLAAAGGADPCVGREALLERIAGCVFQQRPSLAIVAGASGAGKTAVLHGLARWLGERRPDIRVVAVDLAPIMAGTLLHADRENLLAVLTTRSVAPHTVLAIEHIEAAVLETSRGGLLLARALDRGRGSSAPSFQSMRACGEWRRSAAGSRSWRCRNCRWRKRPRPGTLPATAIDLLDRALAVARLAGVAVLRIADLHAAVAAIGSGTHPDRRD